MTVAKMPKVRIGDGAKDFDFYTGSWKIHNRRLRECLCGCQDWDEFEATSTVHSIWGGAANLDEYEGTTPAGPIHGLTLRLYDPEAQQWRLFWANQRLGKMESPVIGRFDGGRGEFFCQDSWNGRAILTRYVWSDITPDSCRWEQAFSEDVGRTWETNWIMESARVR
jgi:hypothetical protein